MIDRVRVGDCVDSCENWNPSTGDPEGEFVYIDIASVDRDEKRILGAARIPRKEAPSRARQLVRVNDVLVSTVRPNLNAVAMVPSSLDGSTASTGFTVLRPRADTIDAAYLFHWVKTPQFVDQMVRQATGASYPAVTDKIVRNAELPLPSLPQQRRIAGILDKVDALRAKRREAIAKVDQLLQSVFSEMFGDVSSNEAGWQEVGFADLVESTKLGLVRAASEFGDGPELSTPYIRMDAIGRNGEFLPQKVKKTNATPSELQDASVQYGDLLFNTRNSRELVGKAAIFDLNSPWIFNNNLMRIRFNKRANPFYVLRYLMSRRGQMELEKRKSGTTNVFAVYYKDLRSLPVVVPPRELQDRFQRAVEWQKRVRDQFVDQESKLQVLLGSLQEAAFSGRI